MAGHALAGGVEAGHHRADADRLDLGDLGVAEAADLPEPQRLPERHGQLAEQAQDALGLDAGHDDVFHLGGGRRVDLPQRLRGAGPALAPAPVEGAVAHDPEGPGVEAIGVGPAPGAPDAQPCLLAGVFRLPLADDGGGVPQGVPRPAGVEVLERAATRSRAQLGDGHQIPNCARYRALVLRAPFVTLSVRAQKPGQRERAGQARRVMRTSTSSDSGAPMLWTPLSGGTSP